MTYPLVAKSLRDIFLGKGHSTGHTCAMSALGENALGYDDLNKLMANPQPLEFILGNTMLAASVMTIWWKKHSCCCIELTLCCVYIDPG